MENGKNIGLDAYFTFKGVDLTKVRYMSVEYYIDAQTMPGNAKIRSGYLEMSNVQVVTEMVNMISVTRAYETNQKIMQTYDSSLEIAVNQLGKLQ